MCLFNFLPSLLGLGGLIPSSLKLSLYDRVGIINTDDTARLFLLLCRHFPWLVDQFLWDVPDLGDP